MNIEPHMCIVTADTIYTTKYIFSIYVSKFK